jgi:hypothetical protein
MGWMLLMFRKGKQTSTVLRDANPITVRFAAFHRLDQHRDDCASIRTVIKLASPKAIILY